MWRGDKFFKKKKRGLDPSLLERREYVRGLFTYYVREKGWVVGQQKPLFFLTRVGT